MITVIEAQEMLKQLTVQDWPNQKPKGRERLHKQLYKKAYPDTFKEGRKVSAETLANALMKGSV